MSHHGTVHLKINRWIEVSFCLPQKVHGLALKTHQFMPPIGAKNIQQCLESLRPYHGVLLLVEAQELIDALPLDASPAFIRFVQVLSKYPLKNLLQLADDADIALSQALHIVAQLVYWAKATIIFPLCESNVYMIHPLAPTSVYSPLVKKFGKKFPDESLLIFMSQFSLGISLGELREKIKNQSRELQALQVSTFTNYKLHSLIRFTLARFCVFAFVRTLRSGLIYMFSVRDFSLCLV